MWDSETLVVYSWGPVEGETKNPIDMWIDDCVSLVTVEAIAMEEIIKHREVLKKESFREYWERTRGTELNVKLPTSC